MWKKETCAYQCQECEESFPSIPQGNCPYCGSEAILTLGWDRVSSDERGSWLDRIRGRSRRAPRDAFDALASLRR